MQADDLEREGMDLVRALVVELLPEIRSPNRVEIGEWVPGRGISTLILWVSGHRRQLSYSDEVLSEYPGELADSRYNSVADENVARVRASTEEALWRLVREDARSIRINWDGWTTLPE